MYDFNSFTIGTIFVDGFKEGIRKDGITTLTPISSPGGIVSTNKDKINNYNNNTDNYRDSSSAPTPTVHDATTDSKGYTSLQSTPGNNTVSIPASTGIRVPMKDRLVILVSITVM